MYNLEKAMFLNKSTRYWLATLGFAVTLFFAFRYFWGLTTSPHPVSDNPRLVAEGLALFTAAAITITVRAYYRKSRFDAGVESATASEVAAIGLLGQDRTKQITVKLTVGDGEYARLETEGKLRLAPGRFNRPVRVGDTVRICTDSGNLERCIRTSVQNIDGVNQLIVLERINY